MTGVSERIRKGYFVWLSQRVREPDDGFEKLTELMSEIEFIPSVRMDANRAEDGVELRQIFGAECGYSRSLIEEAFSERLQPLPASIFEVMCALAMRCEDTMSDPAYGDRTRVWFYTMIDSLGLTDQRDGSFDERRCRMIFARFMKRKYEPDGRGGLFYIPGIKRDMRKYEIWYQMAFFQNDVIRRQRGVTAQQWSIF